VPDPAAAQDLLRRHHRRLYVYLRALLPDADIDGPLGEVATRIARQAKQAPPDHLTDWADGIARQVAAERRKTITPLPFSDDLFRQLADSAGPILDLSEKRPAALAEVLRQLPPPERDLLRRKYELGLNARQIADADGRPVGAVARDLTTVHETLVSAVREALPDAGPAPPGGAADIGRLSDQLIDGTITEDGRLVLETLLLADAAAQIHYHRHAALAADLTWTYGRAPALPEKTPEPPTHRLSARERIVTAVFVIAILAVIVFVVIEVAGRLARS
jgi:DNA-directed RNA polymerase specialized sigma24 family protein